MTEKVSESPNLAKLDAGLRERVTFDQAAGTLTVSGALTAPEEAALAKCFKTDAAKQVVQRIYDRSRGRVVAPAGDPTPMKVPALAIKVGLVVKPLICSFLYNASMPSLSAPSA